MRTRCSKTLVLATTACLGALVQLPAFAFTTWEAQDNPTAQQHVDCDRQCLRKFIDAYMTAMLQHDPTQLPWTAHPKFSENNVVMPVGEGLWRTIDGQGPYKLYFADPQTGEAGFFGTVEEDGHPSVFSLRLRVDHGRIAEAETLVARKITMPFVQPGNLRDDPLLNAVAAPDMRATREQLIAIGNSYWDTLQQNDGTVFAPFDPRCNRVEDGVQTTNNLTLKSEATNGEGVRITSMGCDAQFRTGYFRYVTRIRDRRFVLVDRQRNLVLGMALFDHSGVLSRVTLTNGRAVPAEFHVPWSWLIAELFKIENGKIREIQALVIQVPYDTPSVW